MQRKLLVAIFVLLLVAIVAILAFLLSSNKINSVVNTPVVDGVMKMAKQIASPQSWSSKLANIKSTDYLFSVNELYVELDLDRRKLANKSPEKRAFNAKNRQKAKVVKKEIYQITIDRGDNYSLYCIRQTLSAFDFSYSIEREKGQIQVRIDEKKSDKLLKIVDKLKEYDINSVIEKVWL